MKYISLSLFALLLAWQTPAASQTEIQPHPMGTGLDFVEHCKLPLMVQGAESRRSECQAFVDGITSFYQIYTNMMGRKCLLSDQPLSTRELSLVLLDYIDAHEESAHFPTALLAGLAFHEKYRCERLTQEE